MAKRRSIKKFKAVPKIKSSFPKFNLQETSFNELSFKNKIITVVLIVLVIGIIASLFPGKESITGGTITDTIFRSIDNTDIIIHRVFPYTLSADRLLIYEKFVLFLLLFTLLSGAAKLLNFKGITNLVVAGAISLISVWFIPDSVLAMIGVTYSSTYASFLILVPVLTVGFIAWKIPGTKGGCWAKMLIYFVLFVVFSATKEGILTKYPQAPFFALQTDWFSTFTDTIILILFIFTIYYLIRALTISSEDELDILNKWKEKQQAGIFTPIVVNEIGKRLEGTTVKYLQKYVKR